MFQLLKVPITNSENHWIKLLLSLITEWFCYRIFRCWIPPLYFALEKLSTTFHVENFQQGLVEDNKLRLITSNIPSTFRLRGISKIRSKLSYYCCVLLTIIWHQSYCVSVARIWVYFLFLVPAARRKLSDAKKAVFITNDASKWLVSCCNFSQLPWNLSYEKFTWIASVNAIIRIISVERSDRVFALNPAFNSYVAFGLSFLTTFTHKPCQPLNLKSWNLDRLDWKSQYLLPH